MPVLTSGADLSLFQTRANKGENIKCCKSLIRLSMSTLVRASATPVYESPNPTLSAISVTD
jgi:hypothetical protein